MKFTSDQLVAACQAVVSQDDARQQVSEILLGEVGDPAAIVSELGEPRHASIQKLHVSDQLTVINVVWAPRMTLMPHNHNMWAVIGVYQGREDNIFWRRVAGAEQRIEAAGARSIGPGEVQSLGPNAIHSVTNPTDLFTAAIHIYGGNFFEEHRSEWSPDSLLERPYDIDKNLQLFETENEIAAIRSQHGGQGPRLG